jgi:hypothetical protein
VLGDESHLIALVNQRLDEWLYLLDRRAEALEVRGLNRLVDCAPRDVIVQRCRPRPELLACLDLQLFEPRATLSPARKKVIQRRYDATADDGAQSERAELDQPGR